MMVTLLNYERPRQQVESVVQLITGRDGKLDEPCCLDLKLRQHERAVITSIEVVYWQSTQEVQLCIQCAGHTKVPFVVPAGVDGTVPELDRCIYQPNFRNLGFDATPYIGMETCIAQARSSIVGGAVAHPEYEYFATGDPFLFFLMKERNAFSQVMPYEIEPCDSNGSVHRVTKHAVNAVRKFFERSFFPMFHYVNAEDTVCVSSNSNNFERVAVLIRCEYVVVRPEIPKISHAYDKLKF
jgi:hypothetical protein